MTERKVEQGDIDCFKAIFGIAEAFMDPEGDDAETLQHLAAHRLAERRAVVEWLRRKFETQGPAHAEYFATAIEAGAHVGGEG